MTAEGEDEPAAWRRAIRVPGKMQKEEQLSTARVIISSLAQSGVGFTRCSSFIAEMASGVAALPIPRKFAQTFEAISPMPIPLE